VIAPNSSFSAVSAVCTAAIHVAGVGYQAFAIAAALLHDLPQELTQPASASFFNQNIIITGASSGIGADMARLLAARNTSLVLAARRLDKLEIVAQECRDAGAKQVLVVAYDAADEDAGVALINYTLRHLGRLDTLILNAGMAGPWAKMADLPDLTSLYRLMNVNYWGYVRATHAALPALAASHGRLVAVSSFYGRIPAPYQAGYSATKHAMQGFFNTLRPELAAEDVSVTVHLPGGIATEVQVCTAMDGWMFGSMAGCLGAEKMCCLSPALSCRASLKQLDTSKLP
jgi:short-subunit dehydrogenase